MGQIYSKKTLKVIDEQFVTESKTHIATNKGIRMDFTGSRTVMIYNVATVDEVDYLREGINRFGDLIELGVGTDEYRLSQDKAFTFSVDRGNLNDSEGAQEVKKAVARQVRKVSIPNTDKYNLSTWAAYAAIKSQVVTQALTNTNTYQYFLAHNAAMTDAEVPEEGRVAFITAATHNLLKRDPEFKRDCDTSYKDAKTGVIGMVDGITLKKVPAPYLPANVAFILVHEEVSAQPKKFDMTRVLDEVRGIDGWVAEGRRYYDLFILSQKSAGVRAHKIA